MLPLVFVSIFFLISTFFSMEFGFYPKYLDYFSKEYVFSLDIFLCPDVGSGQEAMESIFCKRIEAIRLFVNSILLIVFLAIFLRGYRFIVNNLKNYAKARKESLEKNIEIPGRKFFLKWIEVELLFVLSWPLEFLKRILTHVYMLDDREENRFLKSAVDKPVLVTLKSNRVYVGTLVEGDLRQSSDDDDALLLWLSLSGYRDISNGVLRYKTSYDEYSPKKLLFMREIESISIYRDDVSNMFVTQKCVEYSWDK